MYRKKNKNLMDKRKIDTIENIFDLYMQHFPMQTESLQTTPNEGSRNTQNQHYKQNIGETQGLKTYNGIIQTD